MASGKILSNELHRHPSVSGDNGVCARRCQSVAEMQHRLWL